MTITDKYVLKGNISLWAHNSDHKVVVALLGGAGGTISIEHGSAQACSGN